MTSDSQLICRRCGYRNVPGDTFCGSCGAFLEWEGQPAGADAPPPAQAGDPDVPAVGGGGEAGPSSPGGLAAPPVTGAPPAAWSPGPAVASSAAPAQPTAQAPDLGLLRCSACGIANPATRTFCQSCGAKLAEAARIADPSATQIAAAVAAPNRPPAAPVTNVQAGTRPTASKGGSRGLIGWIVVLGLLGVLVGVGVVVGGSLLKGQAPASEARTAPSASGGTSSSGAPASPGDASASGSAPGEGQPSASAGPAPVKLALTGATASSVVGDLEKFQPGMAIDGDPKTSWQEGAKVEKGQWIEVAFAPASVSRVVIRNGYGASTALYKGNRRLKDVLISIDGGPPKAIRLKDTSKAQTIALEGPAGATSLRITIVSTYAGTKTAVTGTPFDDAAVSEVQVLGVPGS